MVVLHATKRLMSRLPAAEPRPLSSDTALGDWYGNRIVVFRRPLLLLVSQTSLLPILQVARDLRGLPDRLAGMVEARLRHLGVDDRLISWEVEAMSPVVIAPTADRSVVGTMVDFAKAIPDYLSGPRALDLEEAEALLARSPCRCSGRADRVIFPDTRTRSALESRWLTTGEPQP